MRRSNCSASGYSLLEVLLTVSLLSLLLFAVGDVVAHVLDTTMRGEGRQNVSRSADELAFRLGEEARSSTAVYIPSVYVLGRPNMLAAGSQEVDFFRKASDGSSAFVAYHYDAPSGSVMRYEFVPEPGSTPQIIHQDEMADHVASFTAEKMTAQAAGGVVGAGSVDPVNIYYGSHDRVGGNGIVAVTVVEGLPGEPQRRFDVHLASRAAPTDVSILVPAGSPPPSPSPSNSPISVGFLLVSPNFHPPHGPYHGGDPGRSRRRPSMGRVSQGPASL